MYFGFFSPFYFNLSDSSAFSLEFDIVGGSGGWKRGKGRVAMGMGMGMGMGGRQVVSAERLKKRRWVSGLNLGDSLTKLCDVHILYAATDT